MIRTFPQLLENIADSTARALVAQQKYLDSLAIVALDNKIALDNLLAEQGSVCAMTNTICCTWIDTSGELET